MNIAIIGCGYIGEVLSIQLQSAGHQVSVTTRSADKAARLSRFFPDVHILYGNDKAALTDLLKEKQVLFLCLSADHPKVYRETYLETVQTLESILSTHHQVVQLVYTGSTSVYGERSGQLVDENTTISPARHTSQILADTEKLLLAMQTPSRSVCIFRLGEIYGPERSIANRLHKLRGRCLPGTGDQICNLIHRDDVVAALIFAMKQRLTGIYNLVNDLHLPRKELYRQICTDENIPLVQWDPLLPSLHGGNRIVSNAKIRAAGFIPRY
jgi:nucleoside-diphosphate-sugar epimerase